MRKGPIKHALKSDAVLVTASEAQVMIPGTFLCRPDEVRGPVQPGGGPRAVLRWPDEAGAGDGNSARGL